MAQKFKKKTVEKRSYKKNKDVLKIRFGFISSLKLNFNRLQDKFLNFKF